MLRADLMLNRPSSTSWVLAGDFNVKVNEEEKRGGLPFRLNEGADFLQFMLEAGVCDADFSGTNYTWCNNRQGRAQVWKHLDRLLLNLDALHMGNNILVQHLVKDPLDHAPLLLLASSRLDNEPKPFWFINVWTTKARLLDVIREGWAGEVFGSPLCILATKLRRIKQVLKRWSKDFFGDIFKAVRDAERAVTETEIA
ncbi:uncharacterized protein [Coffea arabica]|uniref:Endonuclease/exonuclease/phosphatase domain-containing protein n=1 Tax=Coffea arabica TaxID=13443 RepID=A0ABM4VQE6_COFAR